ncbi:sulfatase-like hydrolase/transferase [Chitinasiproducens palmae]|uniref:Arylsulfatase A n=1 Tax=Chitinasiproducens palmae TaxID=1770053 RepID=A0A1H2PJG6_9BURK|nr:sulfatase-like hydrolase/transferase [Chitinasiproducens palmae]SDV46479.1 Arylsulfatase A [Chitinasiproducens palmae]
MTRNVLFIMCDQLRADHLACYGHPYLRTPNIDLLASRGNRFSNAFVQSGVCGPSRMSFYTGRYVSSHGASWNCVPLSIGEMTLGAHLAESGRRLALCGKSHFTADQAAMKRLAIDGDSELGVLLREGHFTLVDRYDGHRAEPVGSYAQYLRGRGYDSEDPWSDFVISAEDENGQVVNGWHMRHARLPARVAEADSETAYTTRQAIDFIERHRDAPWVLHLSYVKPHWPYIAPAPYHDRYSPEQCLPVVRRPDERDGAHPVTAAYRQHEESRNFARDEVIRTVRPAYQGLIEQIDDHLGELWEALDRVDGWRDTLIVFTSDHGDFLGDHWLGEKELFYDTVQRVPFIVYDPSPEADATRGQVRDELVEAIDTVPTILDALELPPVRERIEGRSLLTLTRQRGVHEPWRDAVFSELDYAFREARLLLGRAPDACRGWMVRTSQWKYLHWQGFAPQLYDLANDPQEFHDLAGEASMAGVIDDMRARLLQWFCERHTRTTISDAAVAADTHRDRQAGVYYGLW